MTDIVERLRLIQAWQKNGGPTPPVKQPCKYEAAKDAADEIERLRLDAFGEPRTRYVRVTLDGAHCVMHPSEGDSYLKDARDCGDEGEYTVADVYLSERELEDLGEFDGF